MNSFIKDKKAMLDLIAEEIKEKNVDYRFLILKGFDDTPIYVRIWDKVNNPKGVIYFTHGMVEHGERYDEFGKYLNKEGYILVLPDIRGHGRTAGSPEKVGKYEGDMFEDIVKDSLKFLDALQKYYDLPLVLMGHSYGSFITQRLLQVYHTHTAGVLIGSASFAGKFDPKLGKMVAGITATFKGKLAPAKMIYKMTFGNYGKGLENGNWLTHDLKIVEKYNEDPFCGNVCCAQFYKSMFKHLIEISKTQNLRTLDKEKPLLVTSGKLDPVGGKNNSLVDNLAKRYKEVCANLTYKLWENGYHEILNETFRQEVYEYIVNWLNNNVK